MRLYETTFIVNPQTDESSIDRAVKAVTGLINEHGGKIVIEDRLGIRRMAYPIAGFTQGHYTSLVFEAPTPVMPLLERHYRLNDAYIRYLTILFEGDPEKVREQQMAFNTALEAHDRAEAQRHAAAREAMGERGGRRFRDRGDREHRGERYDRSTDRPVSMAITRKPSAESAPAKQETENS